VHENKVPFESKLVKNCFNSASEEKFSVHTQISCHEILFTMSFVSIIFPDVKAAATAVQSNGRNNCERHEAGEKLAAALAEGRR
jgi:hypothetical protein